ncbi:MAG: hypothetical protein COV76_05370 [Candidatus Omnitrophica bacterium CG11_big_fil_rev_8_21_14_0_20_64_10]|nr:MAG: hypothetical protein COV76_05370 [Candidatus Omnitrophica bacterium CG11_big_fil_rev_8_21_14_0_20_64_10]
MSLNRRCTRFPPPAEFQGILLFLLLVVGCTPYVQQPPVSPPVAGPVGRPDLTTHQVQPGETLWRISKRYGVSTEVLARANRLSDPARIRVGQILTVPHPARGGRRPESALKPVSEVKAFSRESRFAWPVQGKVIGLFGMRRSGVANKGIDIAAERGAVVGAAKSGQVTFVHAAMPGLGRTIIVTHADGFATVYGHLDEVLVTQGQVVNQRQSIGRVGLSGRTEVPMLHFEIRQDDKPQNPLRYLPG